MSSIIRHGFTAPGEARTPDLLLRNIYSALRSELTGTGKYEYGVMKRNFICMNMILDHNFASNIIVHTFVSNGIFPDHRNKILPLSA